MTELDRIFTTMNNVGSVLMSNYEDSQEFLVSFFSWVRAMMSFQHTGGLHASNDWRK